MDMALTFLVLSTICFLIGFLIAIAVYRSGRSTTGLNMAIIAVGFVFQCLFLWERGQLHGRCPITSGSEVLVFISWSIVIMYFVVGRAYRLSLLGVFTEPTVFIFQSVALGFLVYNDPGARPVETMDPWLEMHASMSLLAYGAFTLAALAGLMYLLQNNQLKSRHPGRLSRKLPPVKYLADALIRLLIIGLILMTIGVISAFYMVESPTAIHLAASGGVWLIYCAILLVHLFRRQSPRVLAICSIVAFSLAIATLLVL